MRKTQFGIALIGLMLITGIQILNAYPSGGPYGPVAQTYALPQVDGQTYYVAVDGNPKADGKTLERPTTIEAAIERVKTGDAIVMRGGVYRTGNLLLNQGITIQPYLDEEVILKGTFVAKEWTNLKNGLWTTHWTHLFPSKPDSWWQRNVEGIKTPLHKFNNDMVFVDGEFLQSKGWEGDVDAHSFYIDYETGAVYIGTDPTDKLVEITAFNVALHRKIDKVHGKKSDKKGFALKGLTFTQYAYRAIEMDAHEPVGLSPESDHGKDIIGASIENCTISFCSRVAGYFRGDGFTMRHCKISDTSTEGVYLLSSADALLEKNIFTRNNIEGITGYYPSAVKIFNQTYRTVCNDNLVIDLPNSNGIWYDVGNVDGVFINNWVQNVGSNRFSYSKDRPWPSDNGFFFEISKGAVCAGNVFVNCDHGTWALNSNNVHFYNNSYVNSMACFGRNERSAANDHFGWHPSTGPDVDERDGHIFVNNLMVSDETFRRPMLYIWQPAALCNKLSKPQLEKLNNNLFINTSDASDPVILFSPADNEACQKPFKSLDDFTKKHPEYARTGVFLNDYKGPLFKSPILNNYYFVSDFKLPVQPAEIPEKIKKLIGQDEPGIGAFPVAP